MTDPTEPSLTTPSSAKKVRLACRRCRAKRVKCDGGIPACGNCARAGVRCVDVDGRNNDLSIPRDFATRCCTRIKWLEEQIKFLDPSFDLSRGPPLETALADEPSTRLSPVVAANETANGRQSLPASEGPPELSEPPPATSSGKRSYASVEASDIDQPVSVEARSVAIELGMLSLHSDSRQKHYLGSSSGLLFTRLIGLDCEESPSPASSTSTVTSQRRRLASPRNPSREICQTLYAELAKELPSSDDASTLLEIYFRDIHFDYPFLHPISLIKAYRALSECARLGCNGPIDRNGWPTGIRPFPYNGRYDTLAGNDTTPISIFTATFHLYMVFSLAAGCLTRTKNFDYSPARFYRVAMTAASECFSSISISALQAVLLLTVQGLNGAAGVNVWTLSCIAMSHCIDLGIHREPMDLSDQNPIMLSLRRLIFHTVYSLDRSIATIQGRPLGIRDETFDVLRPTLEDITKASALEGDELGLDVRSPSPEYFRIPAARFKMDEYFSEIKLLLYRLPDRGKATIWPTDYEPIQARIKTDLDAWMKEIQTIRAAANLGIDEEHVTKLNSEKLRLELLYHWAVTLLYQPSQVFRSPTQYALDICYQSSRHRIHIYKSLSDEERLYYNWRNVHGIFSSGATIVYCFWASRALQETTPFAEAVQDLRTCSNLLSIGSQWWPSVRNGKDSFDKMVDLTIKRLSSLQNQSHSHLDSTPQRQRQRRRTTRSNAGTNPPSLVLDVSPIPTAATDAELQRFVDMEQPGATFDLSTTSYPDSNLNREFDSQWEPFDGFHPDGIDSAMEEFLAEYLHGDWGWDPFSGPPEGM